MPRRMSHQIPGVPVILAVALALSLAWMSLVITGATLLLYRLIQAGNLVNVTSLFYLVPAGTALLDWLVLGNRLAPLALAGMAAIVGGLVLVLRAPAPRRPSGCSQDGENTLQP